MAQGLNAGILDNHCCFSREEEKSWKGKNIGGTLILWLEIAEEVGSSKSAWYTRDWDYFDDVDL